MTRFREKTEKIEVEAVQWFPGKEVLGVRVLGEKAYLERLEGDVEIFPGDWIVTTEYSRYAMNDHIFHRVYEVAA